MGIVLHCRSGDRSGHRVLPGMKSALSAILLRELSLCLDWHPAREQCKAAITKYARVGTRPRPVAVIGDPPRRSVTHPDHCGGPVAFGVGGEFGVGASTRITRSRPCPQTGQRWISLPVRRSIMASTGSGGEGSGSGWSSNVRQRVKFWCRQRLPSRP